MMVRRRYRRSTSGSAALACASVLLFVLSAFALQSMIANFSDYLLLGYQRVYAVCFLLSDAARDPTESLFDYNAFFSGVSALADYVKGPQLLAPYSLLNLLADTLFLKLAACIILLSAATVLMAPTIRNPRVALAAITVAIVAMYFAHSFWNLASILSLETRIVQLICVNVDFQLTRLYGSDWGIFLRLLHGINLSPRDLFNPSIFSVFYYGFAESHRSWLLEVGVTCTVASAIVALTAAKVTK
ncbi:MAG: hypothetical protein KIH01_06050 [Candidatus Freyarchaeota archaeon]|nr:hypothetical protein [Candidatus Jordarchaeia archaeon]